MEGYFPHTQFLFQFVYFFFLLGKTARKTEEKKKFSLLFCWCKIIKKKKKKLPHISKKTRNGIEIGIVVYNFSICT